MEKMRLPKKEFVTKEIKSLVNDALASLREDPMVYPIISEQLKLTKGEAETYVGALLDFQEDVHYCASCPGLENCQKPHAHFSLRLEKEGGVVNRHYDPCVKMISLASFQNRYVRCSFPASWRDDGLENIKRSEGVRKPVMLAMAKAVNEPGKWFFLNGNSGSGKTYMLACYANEIASKKGVGAFCDTGLILSELKEKSINDKEGFESLMNALSTCSILVLDDFGNEYKTEYVYTSLLFPLLAARDKANLPTAFASDFSIKQIVGMYKAKIGYERATQLLELFQRRCGKEYDVSGVPLH